MHAPRFALSCALMALVFSVRSLSAEPGARVEFPTAAQPQLFAAADGPVWLVYGHLRDTPVGPAAAGGVHAHQGHQPPSRAGDVFVTSSTDGGATFGAPVRVASVEKLMLGRRRGPRIAAHGNHVTVTLIAHELLAFASRDGGRTWNGPVVINTIPTSAREGLHDLACGPDGRLFVTWLDLRAGKMELYGAESRDGGFSWGENERLYASPDKSICECCHPSALVDSGGNLALMWRNSIGGFRDMWLMTRRAGAPAFSAAARQGGGQWELKACPMDGGDIVALGDGKFCSVWQRAGGVFFSREGQAETKLGRGTQPVAAHVGADTLVVWQNGADLWSARLPHAPAPELRARNARFAVVVALPRNAGAVLAYESGSGVIVERP